MPRVGVELGTNGESRQGYLLEVVNMVAVEQSKSILVRAERRLCCSECSGLIKLHSYFVVAGRLPLCYECGKRRGLVGGRE